MSCCGSRRAALKHHSGLRTAPMPVAAEPQASPAGQVELRYQGPVPMALPSLCGGPPYALARHGQSLRVDARDAQALLQTGWFALAG